MTDFVYTMYRLQIALLMPDGPTKDIILSGIYSRLAALRKFHGAPVNVR
jgi:hypothetical protein